MTEKLALCKVQFHMGLIASQLRLFQFAPVRTPTEDRNLQCRDSRVAKISYSIRVDRELICIDSVEVVNAERWQQSAQRRCYLVVGDRVGGKRRVQVRI